MPSVNISAGDWKGVARYHFARVQAIVLALGKRPSAWQEVADHYGLEPTNPTNAPPFLTNDTALFMWLEPAWEWMNASYAVTHGFRVVKADGWYLSGSGASWVSWQSAYAQDPLTDAVCTYTGGVQNCTCYQPADPIPYGCFNIVDPVLVARVIGGEASAWAEEIDATNVLQTLWPRVSAVAERLWSAQSVVDADAAAPRLAEHRCRLVARGIPATPIEPGWCDAALR